MPLHDDEMNMRREKREAQRRKQQAEAKRLRITLILAAVVLVLCTAGIVFLTSRSDSSQTTVAAETRPTQKPTQATEPATRAQKSTKTTIHIKAAGDLNVTNTVINAGVAVGGYNYTRAFMDVASTLSDADLTVLNLEGNICGEPYGSDTTSAPRELLDGLRNAGVDLIQMANSCTINNGLIGLTSTLQSIRAAGLEPVGAFASESEFQQSKGYTITEAQGVKVAFVAFTKGLGGRGLPAGNDNLVNILYEDYASTYDKIDRTRITSVLKAVEAEKPDIVLVQGDTTTAFAAALAAYYLRIPVGHVEAGLRTRDIYSPYPEEFNRQAVSIVSRYNFAPTEQAKENLLAEGRDPSTIHVTGNTVIDALKTTVRADYTHPELAWAAGKRLILITAHRRENLGEPMRHMFRAIRRVLDEDTPDETCFQKVEEIVRIFEAIGADGGARHDF